MSKIATPPQHALPESLRALGYRNYRLYFAGQLVSLAGTWMQQIAMSWLVYRLTGSAFLLGLVAFCGQIPILLLAPFGGMWSDRLDRRRLLLASQSLSMIQACILAGLTLTGLVQAWHLVAMALFLGMVNALDVPTRQAFAIQLVDKREDLANAIALNSFTMNAARLVGPAIAGLAVSWVGEGVCFLFNAVSYLAVIAALLAINTRHEPAPRQAALSALKEGFVYAFGHRHIRAALMLVAAVSFFGTSFAVLMPMVVHQTYGGAAHTFGLLMACSGVGAMGGTVLLASRKPATDLAPTIARSAPLAGVALIMFSRCEWLWLAAPLLALVGFGMIVTVASANTLIQTLVKNELRGRVMAIFSMAFLGIAPLGSLATGSLAHLLGTQATLLACGIATLAAGLAYSRWR